MAARAIFEAGSDSPDPHAGGQRGHALTQRGNRQTVGLTLDVTRRRSGPTHKSCGTPNLRCRGDAHRATLNSQTPHEFLVTHVTESSSTTADGDFDIPLALEYAANVSSGERGAAAIPILRRGRVPGRPRRPGRDGHGGARLAVATRAPIPSTGTRTTMALGDGDEVNLGTDRLDENDVPLAGRRLLRGTSADHHGGGAGPFGLRGRPGRRRGPRRPLGLRRRRQDRLVREHGRGGELRLRQQVISTAADGAHLGLRGGRGRGWGCRTSSRPPLYGEGTIEIAWYENTDGAGSFGSPAGHLHGGGPEPTRSSRRTWTATGTWMSSRRPTATTRSPGMRTRTGRGASAASRSSPRRRRGLESVFAADVDGDGDLDVLSASVRRRQDRLVREHGRGGELRQPAG